jgi:hypothetical protein
VNAEVENAEKSWESFSAGFAVSAFNVILHAVNEPPAVALRSI